MSSNVSCREQLNKAEEKKVLKSNIQEANIKYLNAIKHLNNISGNLDIAELQNIMVLRNLKIEEERIRKINQKLLETQKEHKMIVSALGDLAEVFPSSFFDLVEYLSFDWNPEMLKGDVHGTVKQYMMAIGNNFIRKTLLEIQEKRLLRHIEEERKIIEIEIERERIEEENKRIYEEKERIYEERVKIAEGMKRIAEESTRIEERLIVFHKILQERISEIRMKHGLMNIKIVVNFE